MRPMSSSLAKLAVAVLAALTLLASHGWIAVAIAGADDEPPFGLSHGSRIDDHWLAAGQPTPEQLAELAAAGFRSIVDLRTAAEDRGFDEAAESARLGLRYHSIPVSSEIDPATFDRVLDTLEQAEGPLLLHCASSNRVGAMLYAYLATRRGVPRTEALERAHRAGLRSARLEEQAAAYIAERAATRVILVRHAEKTAPSGDPPLSEAGRQRAAELARTLSAAGVDAVYATQFARTQQTAQPLAAALGLETVVVNAGRDYAAHMAEIARSRHAGEVIVVVNHSNTLPEILAELGIDDPPAIADHRYDDLFVVHLAAGQPARLLSLKYGAPTP